MRLRDALKIQRGDVVAFIGAGGKTSALLRLAHELRAEGWRVLATTTTRVARWEAEQAPLAACMTSDVKPATVRQWLNKHGFVFLYGGDQANQGKVSGLSPHLVPGLMDSINSDVLLIEADGARRLPFKAPHDHEPVIPPDTSLVVPVAGLDALGQPLDDEHIYNANRILERYGFPEGEPLTPPWMAVTIRDPELGLRHVPDGARVVPLLNKVPANGYGRRLARRVARIVLNSPRIEAVALGSMQAPGDHPVYELQQRIAAVVLAAGTSSRMGQPKALLPWDSRTVIETIVNRLLAARLAETMVVTGFQADAIERRLTHLPVQTIYNPVYAEGEMLSSLQAALRALPETIAACLVVLGDQPALDPRVINQIVSAYVEGRGNIIVPVYRGERGHPILIDRRFWPELLALESGAPRDVLRRYPDAVTLLEVGTDSILRDIDTPEEYRRERRRAGLR